MTWLLAKHEDSGLGAEGRGPYNQTPGRLSDKSHNTVFFFSFAVAPKYIFLKNVRHKHLLNPMRLALCLAIGNYRIIAQQGNSLVGLSLNRYVMTQTIPVYHFHQSQYFIMRHLVMKLVDLKKDQNFLHFGIWRSIINFMRIWYLSCKNFSKMRLW